MRSVFFGANNFSGFSLVQLIAALIVAGILVATALFAFSDSIHLRSLKTAQDAELQALQTAVDAYYLEHNLYPTLGAQPTLGNPKAIEVDLLIGDYITDHPLDLYYWIDSFGQVWASTYDAPTSFTYANDTFEWDDVEGAQIFEIVQAVSSAQLLGPKYRLATVYRFTRDDIAVTNGVASYDPGEPLQGEYLLITYGNLGGTPAVDGSYTSHPFPPVTDWSWVHRSSRNRNVDVKPASVVAVAAGSLHSLALKSDGTVWSWGYNRYGQLGDGSTSDRFVPTQVKGPNGNGYLDNVIAIAAGTDHSLAIRSDGTVWSWGRNNRGQLGNGTLDDSAYPVMVMNLTDVQSIAAGGAFSLALKRDGTVWSWGSNTYGSLGDNTDTHRSQPVQVLGPNGQGYLTDIVAIAAGSHHSLALRNDGTVWAWGFNGQGQVGGGTTNRWYPVQLRRNLTTPLSDIVGIAAGAYHSLAVTSDGALWSWGRNSDGQLGDGSTQEQHNPVLVRDPSGVGTLSGVISAAGDNSSAPVSFALLNDGTVLSWGRGHLGDHTDRRSTPGPVLGPEGNGYLSDISALSVGQAHILALASDGTVWSWGQNTKGQLGDDTVNERVFPGKVQGLGK